MRRLEAPAAGAEESVVECFQVHRTWRCPADGEPGSDGLDPDHSVLKSAGTVIAFEVSDTGVGIRSKKQRSFSEAFQQPTPAPAANTAVPVWVWPIKPRIGEPAGEKFNCAALPVWEAHSRYICRKSLAEAVAPVRSRSTNPYR